MTFPYHEFHVVADVSENEGLEAPARVIAKQHGFHPGSISKRKAKYLHYSLRGNKGSILLQLGRAFCEALIARGVKIHRYKLNEVYTDSKYADLWGVT